jgi:Amt family ammonium transporter
MLGAARLLVSLRIDDVVGAIPVHLAAGIFGTLVVPLTNGGAAFGAQLLGVAVIGAFTFTASTIVWIALRSVVGLRLNARDETVGADQSELGTPAYHLPLWDASSAPVANSFDKELVT